MAPALAAARCPRPPREPRLRDVLADVDASLHTWLATELAPGVEIGFDNPTLLVGIGPRPRSAGIVNLFLHTVTENLDGVNMGPVRVRDGQGRVTGVHNAPRSYHLSYLVTAWASSAAEEHELLGALIGAHTEQDALHADHLRGALRALDVGMPMRLGWTPGGATTQLWTALGIPMRTALDLTITAPALPVRLHQPAPPVEAITLVAQDHDAEPPPERVRRRWRSSTISEPSQPEEVER
jgi:hypothetical protein